MQIQLFRCGGNRTGVHHRDPRNSSSVIFTLPTSAHCYFETGLASSRLLR